MQFTIVEPKGLSKFLVGDWFEVSIEAESNEPFELELYTNVNRSWLTYHFEVSATGTRSCRLKLNQSGYYKWYIRYRQQGNDSWKWIRDEAGKRLGGEIQVDPAWLSEAIVYNVFVRFFKGRRVGQEALQPGEGGTFDDVKAHLKTLKQMNINTLYLNPIHLIGELYRKYNLLDELPHYLQPGSPYSIKDYKSIDPELTYDRDTKKHLMADPQQEFKELVEAAHNLGIYVIMDLVFNHTAHDFVFQRIRPEWYLYKENITSLEEPYIYPEDLKHGKPWGDPKHTMAPFDHGVWWTDAAQLNWEYMIPRGPNEPPSNTSLKEMWEYFKSIPKYWIRHFGIDGFRCDIAYRIPVEFWRACIAEARHEAQHSKSNLAHDVVFIAEAYTNNLAELQEAGFAAVYGDFSNKLSRPIHLKGYLDYIYNLQQKHFPDGARWFLFPESHDFGRTPQKILGSNKHQPSQAPLRANKSRWLLTATLPGIPLIFNGFEKIEWEPVNLFSYGAVDWESDKDLSEFITLVNQIRHEQLALQKGDYTCLPTNQDLTENTQLFGFLRHYLDETIITIVNMDVHRKAGPAQVYLPEGFSGTYNLTDLLTSKKYQRSGRNLLIELDPGEGHIFKVHFR